MGPVALLGASLAALEVTDWPEEEERLADRRLSRWLCRSEEGSVHSTFLLYFWPGGTVSGLREKEEEDPPGLLKKTGRRWVMVGREMVEDAGAWDVVGQWSSRGVLLRLLPRRGGPLVVLRGGWGETGRRMQLLRMIPMRNPLMSHFRPGVPAA